MTFRHSQTPPLLTAVLPPPRRRRDDAVGQPENGSVCIITRPGRVGALKEPSRQKCASDSPSHLDVVLQTV